MTKKQPSNPHDISRKRRKATSIEAREDQLIALAMDVAEEQMLNGTASSQTINHFLKLGSTKDRLEKETMAERKKLISAKTEAINSSKESDKRYLEALEAMRRYSGQDTYDDIY